MIQGDNFIAIPRITTAERTALPAYNGLLVYDTDLNALYKFENGSWSGFSGGSASWGGIGGTLSNQTDLQNALNTKQTKPFSQAVNTSIDIASTSPVTVYSKALTELSVGDVVQVRIVGSLVNNTGVNRSYTHVLTFGSLVLTIADGTSIAASATNESVHEIEATISITASDFTVIYGELDRGVPSAIDTGANIQVTTVRKAFNESTSDLTGSQTFSYGIFSAAAVATQTFKLRAAIITILKSNP